MEKNRSCCRWNHFNILPWWLMIKLSLVEIILTQHRSPCSVIKGIITKTYEGGDVHGWGILLRMVSFKDRDHDILFEVFIFIVVDVTRISATIINFNIPDLNKSKIFIKKKLFIFLSGSFFVSQGDIKSRIAQFEIYWLRFYWK